VPAQQKPQERLWLNDGSCVRLRSERPNHIWSYDFVSAVTHDGRALRMLTLIDEYTRENLAIRVGHRLKLARRYRHSGRCDRVYGGVAPNFLLRALAPGKGRLLVAGRTGLLMLPGHPYAVCIDCGWCDECEAEAENKDEARAFQQCEQ
jgi:hypothetical protein